MKPLEETTVLQDIEAEKAVLCEIMQDNGCLGIVKANIQSSAYFNLGSHSLIFDAMIYLDEQNKPIDPITIWDRLRELGKQNNIFDIEYLNDIEDFLITNQNPKYHSLIVAEHHIERQLMKFCERMRRQVMNPEGMSCTGLIDKGMEYLIDIRGKLGTQAKLVHAKDLLPQIFQKAEKVGKGEIELGISTGFKKLDKVLKGGFRRPELIILAARPSKGKTSLAVNILANIAVKKRIAIFSLETSDEVIVGDRLLPAIAKVESDKIKGGKYTEEESARLHSAADKIQAMTSFKICDTPNVTAAEIDSLIKLEFENGGIDIAAIDYLGLIKTEGKKSRNDELGSVVRSIRATCNRYNIPIILLSQLNRNSVRENRKPGMTDLRDSGEIEQTADVIMFLHEDDKEFPGMTEVIFEKNKNGETGSELLVFKRKYTKFSDGYS